MSEVLKFELSVEEANLVLAALAKQPFEVVSGLISKIHAQAAKAREVAPAEEVKAEA